MSSLNMVQLIGNLGKNPEIKSMSSGDKVANFSIACTEKWTSKDGEKKEKTEWVNIVCWGNGLVGVIEKYLAKGSKVYVQGQLRTRKYEKDGSDRYATEVVVQGFGSKVLMLGEAKEKSDSNSGGGGSQSYASEGGFEPDQEIPFATPFSIW